MNRRNFLKRCSSLPFVGSLFAVGKSEGASGIYKADVSTETVGNVTMPSKEQEWVESRYKEFDFIRQDIIRSEEEYEKIIRVLKYNFPKENIR